MSIRVTLSANAGAAIELGGVRIWVDALHDTQVPGFSTLRRQQLQQLWTAEPFQAPDAIVYTHCHPDHYARQLTEEAHRRWPQARLLLPQKEFAEQELVSGDAYTAAVGDVGLHFSACPTRARATPWMYPTTGCSSPTARRQSCCRGTVPWGRRRCCR